MDQKEIALWKRIKAFEIDDPDSSYTFSDRLSKENQWNTEFSLRAIEEYKKFMFLICIAEHPLTPSEAVDEVWHLHLLYTQSYWKEFCNKTLGREIHHSPTRGGKQEANKFIDWYSKTLHCYREKFECAPPSDLWPSPEENLMSSHCVKIDLKKYWIIKKLKI